MIYSTSIFSIFAPVAATLKSYGRLLLPLPFCLLLMGCNSPSAPTAENAATVEAVGKMAERTVVSENATAKLPPEDSANPDETITDDNTGQSLMVAAKTDNSAQPRRTPMISNRLTDSALQATLIGDYVGMLPCDFCDGIAITLNLFADGSVLKTSVYENPESPQVPLTDSGIYRQDNDNITIVYEDKRIETYDIQDNHLVMMGTDKSPNADYMLSRK
jgi:uncharacterized lipoprotein NlpE involved in copper resistance